MTVVSTVDVCLLCDHVSACADVGKKEKEREEGGRGEEKRGCDAAGKKTRTPLSMWGKILSNRAPLL